MLQRLTGSVALLIAALLTVGTARAEIAWTYEKPVSERSVGDLLSDILGLSEFGQDYAVIIGLHRFEDFNPLDATENDPQRVFEFLRDEAGFDYILMLRDEEVTYQRLRSLFEFELPRVLDSNDRALFYWSGHGTQFPDARGVELGYLPLISSRADDKSTMVAMRDFARWDNELPAKHALFLLDACFSGLAGSSAQSDERDLEIRELTKPGHHIISAGGRDQQTIASRQEWQGSIFTHALLKALRGGADRYGGSDGGDGVINLYELVADIGETVKNAKAAAAWKRPLRPVLNVFRGEGQFFFLTNRRKQTYLREQGKRISSEFAYGMPIVVMSATDQPSDPGPEPAASNLGQDFQVWTLVQNSSNPIDLQTFIDTFPESIWVPFARNRLAKLDIGILQPESITSNAAASPEAVTPRTPKLDESTGLPAEAVNLGLAALSSLQAAGQVTECDRLAADKWDDDRNGPGVESYDLNPDLAIPACRDAVERWPDVARFAHQYARALAKSEEERNDAQAVNWYRRAADTGHKRAMSDLGWMYAEGRGVEQDDYEAIRLFRNAAEMGDIAAMTNLGRMYVLGRGVAQDDDEAIRWYRKAVDKGYPNAMASLGWMYTEGRGVARDDAQAIRLYREAVEQGDPEAMEGLGRMYVLGRGVIQDDAEAIRWYRKAVDKGSRGGMSGLGWMYFAGRGVKQDDAEAVRWYRKAADKGEPGAMARLGWMYKEGRGVTQNDAEAVRWYREAVKRGDEAWAIAELGWMYRDGRGVRKDRAEAARWLRKAADKGNAPAARMLGWMYVEADGVRRDYAEALRLTRMAVEAGDALAMNNLGWMYERGLGLGQDREEAVRWYRKAAEQGEPFAKKNLSRLGRS